MIAGGNYYYLRWKETIAGGGEQSQVKVEGSDRSKVTRG